MSSSFIPVVLHDRISFKNKKGRHSTLYKQTQNLCMYVSMWCECACISVWVWALQCAYRGQGRTLGFILAFHLKTVNFSSCQFLWKFLYTNEHLGCFHTLLLEINWTATLNIDCRYLSKHSFYAHNQFVGLFSWCIYSFMRSFDTVFQIALPILLPFRMTVYANIFVFLI